MKGFAGILLVVALLATVPLITSSNVVLNFLVIALLIALVGQGWNLLGGYVGQYSFGHAAFFGTGAYATAILQVHYGVNAWVGFAAGWLLSRIAIPTCPPRAVLRLAARGFLIMLGGVALPLDRISSTQLIRHGLTHRVYDRHGALEVQFLARQAHTISDMH